MQTTSLRLIEECQLAQHPIWRLGIAAGLANQIVPIQTHITASRATQGLQIRPTALPDSPPP
ncbi:hypothetical protein A7Q03_04590 [Eikenella sp. NML99-0057]|nr:hypothetical protein A7Q03_04590 [Eikenella sp. NML99-0057]